MTPTTKTLRVETVRTGINHRRRGFHPHDLCAIETIHLGPPSAGKVARLSPVFPFNLLNYAFGLTRVPLRDYFFASWIGMMPGTVMYVYVGSLAGELATLGAAPRARTPAEWTLYAVGLLATVAVTVYITRLAREALARRGAAP